MSQSTTLNLSIPVKLKKTAQRQAKKNNFSSTSDYIQTLIRQDADSSKEKKLFKEFILQGINSGQSKKKSLKNLDSWMTGIINSTK
jgi:Arc/MetJ-type ribon-helix-helix transcriptional regulator